MPTFPRFLRQSQAIDVSSGALFNESYPRICRELGGVPGDDTALADRTTVPPVHRLPERYRMPYKSLGEGFVGRVAEIWALYDSLFRDGTAVLQGVGVVAGTGGLGKTQLAIEYAHRFGSTYTGGVYWVEADLGLVAMITQISGPAGVEVDTRADEGEQVAQLWRELNSRDLPCLVILDNFPENVKLRPYLATSGRLHTIVTTRRQDLAHAAVRLKALSMEEGVRLLNSGDRQFGDAAGELAERLGGLPLALELAKSYLNYRKNVSIPVLLDEIKAAGEMSVLGEFRSEYRDQLPSGHEQDIASTFQLSWDIAPEPAKQLLRVMGELAPAVVPKTLLRTILNLPEQPPLRDELNKGIDELVRLSLAELTSSGDPLSHRLILAFARHRNAVDNASPFDRCRKVLLDELQRANNDPDANTTRELELLIPHAEFLASTDRLRRGDFESLLGFVGIHHRTMGRFTAARHAHSRALASAEKSFEPGHPSIAISQSNLALVLQDLGQLEEARDLLRQAYSASFERYGPDHPHTKTFKANIESLPEQ